MSFGIAGGQIYCPRCGARVGVGAADLHALCCDEAMRAIEAADWQPMETAPRDGTEILSQAKNCGGRWMQPGPAWWAKNTAVDDPVFTHFWANARDAQGHPMPCYHMPLRWRPL